MIDTRTTNETERRAGVDCVFDVVLSKAAGTDETYTKAFTKVV
jgi:hypothetical protein